MVVQMCFKQGDYVEKWIRLDQSWPQTSCLEVNSIQCKKSESDESLGFHMLFELWLFPHKKIHICFGGYAIAIGGLERNALIQYQNDIDIHCQ